MMWVKVVSVEFPKHYFRCRWLLLMVWLLTAWAKGGLDVVIPAGAVFLHADVIVETAFDALTALTIGTYLASDGTTAIDADGLGNCCWFMLSLLLMLVR